MRWFLLLLLLTVPAASQSLVNTVCTGEETIKSIDRNADMNNFVTTFSCPNGLTYTVTTPMYPRFQTSSTPPAGTPVTSQCPGQERITHSEHSWVSQAWFTRYFCPNGNEYSVNTATRPAFTPAPPRPCPGQEIERSKSVVFGPGGGYQIRYSCPNGSTHELRADQDPGFRQPAPPPRPTPPPVYRPSGPEPVEKAISSGISWFFSLVLLVLALGGLVFALVWYHKQAPIWDAEAREAERLRLAREAERARLADLQPVHRPSRESFLADLKPLVRNE